MVFFVIQVTNVLSGVERGKLNSQSKKRSLSVTKFKLYMPLYKIIVTYLFISVHSSVSSVKRTFQSNLNVLYLHSNCYSETQPKQKVFLVKVTS